MLYCDLPHWRLNQQPQNPEPKLYHWALNPHGTQVMPNQLVMVIVQPINLNVFCKLLQRTLSPPGSRLPRRIGNMHSYNYYNPKGKDIDVHFLFLSRGIILWIELPWLENSDVNWWLSGTVLGSAFCGHWFDLQWRRSWYNTADET